MLTARFHDSLDDIEASAWDALAGAANPFVSHAFLAGLERHDCIRREWGWQPHHLTLHDGERLIGAAPVYLKGNSHGEYVFDWGWAHAWEQAGGDYYPKLLLGVPYSPIPGPRLLVADGDEAPALRRALIDALAEEARRHGLSSVHANFLTDDDLDAFDDAWLPRHDIQYHWHNRGYGDFADFLAALKHKKRKNIRHERRQVADSGLACAMVAGNRLSDAEWMQIHALYQATFDEKGNHAALTLDFFRHLAASLGDSVQVALARHGDDILAMALFLRGENTLYGRYWGTRVDVPGLHFELCYYLGIEHAIAHGLQRFEPGAQGRHKMARGFMPTRTHSRHFLVHEGFRAAVARALREEDEDMQVYAEELRVHSPYAEA
ncbi:GNAT family N-acetyltransferase [Oleiagrimonas sp. MCCC 1A03011]|uniref:GNAT family N-acetyltransferase n=1 Tax=Oleiagrimonas sp. MCCC 1A03011 TaxID=1926883 RepID=UPI000DC4B91D|nr:GNAT family N-acetyltransferase [Oleiagrimonas sp. MCCC 1A03011]RAP57791.1 GNAT family N-acetyltransferase [Oleiagrimonas sp. MCCC 1A03011]